MNKIVHALLLVVLLELLWVSGRSDGWQFGGGRERRALKVSAGFPVPAISYTAIRDTGNISAFENYPERSEFLPGLRVSPIAWSLDALMATAAFFGFGWMLGRKSGRRVCAGIVVGAVAGIVASLSVVSALRPLLDWIGLPILLVGLSTSACFFSRGSRSVWQAMLVLVTTAFVMVWVARRVDQFKPESGFSFTAEDSTVWSFSFVEMVLTPLGFCVMLFAPIMLMRKYVPAFQKHESGS